ncbi:hypothetical protein CLCR_04400 [Cladophialophora carrionii]|uniref:t-SNARE coiled-coil homology domain-containing protein n=1 Tax=Cladophialophora carrionii TaxID=86049 RepID=A0A1C1CJD2_9EURO|nr:hypothetical protein CLCR_04400 [Cladophialophora carrionii]
MISQNLNTLSNRLDQHSNNITQRLNAIDTKVDRLSQRVDTLAQRFDSVDVRMDSDRHNNWARLQNAKITSLHANLVPLHDRNNQLIGGFPGDMTAIEALRLHELGRILQALGSDIEGRSSQEKTTALRIAVGLDVV